MDGARKTAILLLSLDQGLAARVLASLPRERLEQATYAVASAENVSEEEIETVLNEFKSLFSFMPTVPRTTSKPIPSSSENPVEPKAKPLVEERLTPILDAGPFAFLKGRQVEEIRSLLADEHPQTIAVISAQLPADTSAAVLAGFGPQLQADVLQRVARMLPTDAEILADIAATLKERLGAPRVKAGGIAHAAAVLRESSRTSTRKMLSTLDDHDSDLADELRQTLFSFDDLLKLDDETLRIILQETDDRQWALALKASPAPVRQKVLNCLPARVSSALKDEMDALGPVRLSEMTSVRQQIADSIHRLEEEGLIALPVGNLS